MIREAKSVHATHQDRTRLRNLIAEYSGLDELALGDNALERAIAQRLAANRLDHLSDYWPLLRRGPTGEAELCSLVQLLTNKETFFFREMHHFQVLRDMILPELSAMRISPVRLWSAGCATGEEPYSLAITVSEYGAQHGSLDAQIIATDIDTDALEKARQGCYGERSVRLVPANLRRRYFSFDGQTHCITPEVAQLVAFRQYNLAAEETPPELSNIDIIFCRNVTIYFNERMRDRLNARLANSLREGGYLFVASAETMGHDRDRLELISEGSTFLFRKTRSSARQPQFAPPELPRKQPRSTPAPSPATAVLSPIPKDDAISDVRTATAAYTPLVSPFLEAVRAFQRQDYEAALRLLDRLPDDLAFWPEVCRLRAATLLQQERLAEAEATCQQLLAHDPWYADAHFLMGLIFRQQDQLDAAIQSLKQAIYLQPAHRDAHFYLAEIYHAVGLAGWAIREYRNTLNILVHRAEDPLTIHLSGLTDEILRQACEVNLNKLQGQQSQILSGRNKA